MTKLQNFALCQLQKKKKTRSTSCDGLESEFNNLSIDFPSIESVEDTGLDDLSELQRICDEQMANEVDCDEISDDKEICDEDNSIKLVEEVENIVQIEEIPSAPIESIAEVRPTVFENKPLYPDLQNIQSTSTQLHMSEKLLSPVVVKPFTALQIEQLYSNQEVKLVEHFENEFVERELKDSSLQEHPLYLLLKKFAKARSRLLQNSNNMSAIMKRLEGNYKNVWKVERKGVSTHGFCSCGKAVRASHDYNFAVFNEDANSDMERNMKDMLNCSCNHHTRFSQDCALYQRQIEQMLGELMNSKAFISITKESPVVLRENFVIPGINENDARSKINNLRLYISILFKFYRESLHDKILINHVQDWITKLISLQLRIATWQDHVFILFHILRCPVGVGNWAASLIQVPKISNCDSYVIPEFQHCIAILSALLQPIKDRSSFLANITKDLKPQSPKSKEEDVWILVDSDGEEGSSSSGECIGLKENDLVALLDQIPFEMIFKAITKVEDKNGDYEICQISGHHIIKTIAFATRFIAIFKQGLATYDTERYKQFAKRLGRLMKHTLFFISDAIKIYKISHDYKDPEEYARMQVEFDEVIIRSAQFIYESKKLSLFQYLADFPYENVSAKSLWKLYYYLHNGDFKVIDEEVSKLILNEGKKN